MTMTNAQVALQAAATWYADSPGLVLLSLTEAAGKLKDWLDLQDAKDLTAFDKGAVRHSSAGHPDQDQEWPPHPLKLHCFKCKAVPGAQCVRPNGNSLETFHPERTEGHPQPRPTVPRFQDFSTNFSPWGGDT